MNGSLSESEIHKNISQNIGWKPVLTGNKLENENKSVNELLTTSGDPLCAMLVLKTIENFMWYNANNLPVMNQNELQQLTVRIKTTMKYGTASKRAMSIKSLYHWLS